MKKILSYILITLILSVNFLAPISVGFNGKNIEIKKNITEAYDAKLAATFTNTDTVIAGTIKVNEGAETYNASVGGSVILILNLSLVEDSTQNTLDFDGKKIENPIANPMRVVVTWKDMSGDGKKFEYKGLTPLGKYTFSAVVVEKTTTSTESYSDSVEKDIAGMPPLPIALNKKGDQTVVDAGKTEVGVTSSNGAMPACSLNPFWGSGTVVGCIAQAFYYVFFVPTSYLFALSGLFFDSTFAYSVQDTSYTSSFVVQGWGLIRDLCNMFFIFIMLYVAIGTTLSLHSMKTKETIVNIVIIGLFINFSLFATQLIIDASNITARVFYNSNAIKLTEKGVDGASTAFTSAGGGGIIPLSSALVNKVNPQNLIIRATEINNVENNSSSGVNVTGKENGEVAGTSIGPGQFILIVIMASAVNIVGFTVFLTIGFLFIARVIGLWLAMILSPLAFFTYILPEMAGTKMIGWKNWWPDTLKMAFLAPVFIFFLYIILKFLETDLISDPSSKTGLSFFIATLIPFAFIMILLIKAKKIATDMSGEFGEMVTKAGSAVGGLALGAATGGAAFAMRGTLGAMGNALAESKFAKTNGRFGRMLGDAGKWTGSKTFDARNSALGAMAGKEMGVDMGKAKEGGYAKHKADVQKRGEERAKSLEVGHDEHEMHDLHDKQEALQRLRDKNAPEIDALEGKIASTQMDATDKSRQAINAEAIANQPGATAAQIATARALRQDAKRLDEEVMELKNQKNAINRATEYRDKDGNLVKDYSDRKEMVNVSSSMVQKTEEDAQNKEAVAQAATNNITTVTTAANAQATAEINQAQITATASITQAQTNAAAAIARAQADTLAANQAKTAAFNNSMMNPQDQNAKNAYDQAVIAYNNAQANVATATTTANNSVIQAQTEATTKVTEATTKANNTMNQTITDTTQSAAAKTTAAATARTTADTLKTAHNSGQKVARSKNELDFEDVPDAKFTISKENSARKNEYANEIQSRWFNKKANAHAAHDIRMNAEIKADVNGH